MDGRALRSEESGHPLKYLDYARLLPRAFQANGFAVVRFGILPTQSRFRGNDVKS
jgi:hypothetical protein